MKNLEEIFELIESMNDDAHSRAWDTWIYADELSESDNEDDWETAEEIREEASLEQAGYFRDHYYDLEEEDKSAILHWLDEDEDFKEQFSAYFGLEEFEDEFN